jgi:hypothetical protein
MSLVFYSRGLTNFSSNLDTLDALANQTDLADSTDCVFVRLLVLGLTERAVLFLLAAVNGLVGSGTDVEGIKLVVLELVLVCRSLVTRLES